MRLLNTTTLELSSFPRHPPPYAILSHTWEDNEAPFDAFITKSRLSISSVSRLRKRKYLKTINACALAKSQDYQWIWIDTCCIDKSSSAELSEAINSMYSFYERAAVCYAYLADVFTLPSWKETVASVKKSRWFTRGWTLQELVAPAKVEFYDEDWTFIGTKRSLASTLEKVTLIPAGLFSEAWETLCAGGVARQSLQLVSVAQRLSWASNRETTRSEDIAYCLMGLFGVHMPLLYGEGEAHAFARLQAEIARKTNDQSLFAWGAWYDPAGCAKLPCYSILAPHPVCFAGVGDVLRTGASNRHGTAVDERDWTPPFEIPNDEYLRIRMRVCRNPEAEADGMDEADHVAFLECDVRGESDAVVGLFVRKLPDVRGVRRYVRVHTLLGRFPRRLVLESEQEDILLGALPRHMPRFEFLRARSPTPGPGPG